MNNLPRECLLLIVSMAFVQDDYWTFVDFVNAFLGMRKLCRAFADTFTLELLSSLTTCSNLQERFQAENVKKYTKTDAKKIFGLTEKDLENVLHETKCNPYYKKAPAMKLYCRKDLVVVAQLKHGTKRLLSECQKKKQDTAAKRRRTIDTARQMRYNRLSGELAKHGLVVRDDSRLCEDYVKKGRGKLDYVVETMVEMNFYFTHTNYQQHYNHIWRIEKEFSGWCDRDEVSEMAKLEAFKDFVFAQNECPEYVPESLKASFCKLKN